MKKFLIFLPIILLTGCQANIKSFRDEAIAVKADPIESSQVIIENNNFNPQKIAVSVGQKVTFINRDRQQHRVISDPHPTHTDLPDLDSNLFKDEIFSLQIDIPGQYGFHLEDNPSISGTIIAS